MQLAQKQGTLDEGSCPSFYAGRKLGEVEQALLWSLLQEDLACPSRVLLDKAARRQMVLTVSRRHANRWRATRGLNRRQGRPGHAEGSQPVPPGAAVVQLTPHMSCVGVHLFAQWLDQREAFAPVVAQLMQAALAHKQTHPDEDFALWHHRESTLLQRFQALLFAPWVGRTSERVGYP